MVGPYTYRRLRSLGVDLSSSHRQRSSSKARRQEEQRLRDADDSLFYSGGVLRHPLANRAPEDIRRLNFERIVECLDGADIPWFVVRNDVRTRYTIGVMQQDRRRATDALMEGLRRHAVYVTDAAIRRGPRYLASMLGAETAIATAEVLRFGSFFEDKKSGFQLGLEYGCDIEYWSYDESKSGSITAPRRNVAAQAMSGTEFQSATTVIGDKTYPTLAVFKQRMLDDIPFPIDAVYTWVDGTDSKWIESKREFEARQQGLEYHPEAHHDARFRSRDELLYSLRSLEMYAPWFRHIYLVTNGQVPEWLRTDHPRLTIVTHDEIYDNKENLPTFNSNSIISRLHHIPGLQEHYVYINDDVFFGRAVSPAQFFTASGLAKVSLSNNRRPFGESAVSDEPHINLTRNIRRLIAQEFGITISRAIKHTPHPQLTSVHNEMENHFRQEYEQTWNSHFRHHDDLVADQLFHYYAQIKGKAVPGNLRYSYVNILDDTYEGTLASLLQYRDRDTFCLNDAPVEGATPIPDQKVGDFLKRYFPVKSSFEV